MDREALQGRLLISSARMDDPNFTQAVIFLVQAGEDGTLGLVLNRALDVSVEEACAHVIESTCNVREPLYKGGPCEGPLMAVHDRESVSDMQIVPKIYLTTERPKIEQLLRHGANHVKFFIGYSGWATGQLDGEIASGSWITAISNTDRVFDTDPDQWTRLITEITAGLPLKREQMPIDPSLN